MTPEAPKQKRKINVELLLGLSATFLSFAALVVSIFQTKIAREQQHASVWPHLSIYASNSDKYYSYKVSNSGIGPAIIKDVTWSVGDSSYTSTFDFIRNELGFVKGLGRSEMNAGSVLTPGDGLSLLDVNDNDSLAHRIEDIVTGPSFTLRIVYSDVYGNCWEIKKGETKALADCPD